MRPPFGGRRRSVVVASVSVIIAFLASLMASLPARAAGAVSEETASVEGVVGFMGAPRAGAWVRACRPLAVQCVETFSDDDGRFRVSGLSPGPAWIIAYFNRELPNNAALIFQTEVDVAAGATVRVDPDIPPQATISGRLTFGGSPSPGRRVSVFHAGFCAGNPDNGLAPLATRTHAPPPIASGTADGEGRFTTGAVAPGVYDVFFYLAEDWDPLSSQYFRTCRTVALKGGDFLQGFDGNVVRMSALTGRLPVSAHPAGFWRLHVYNLQHVEMTISKSIFHTGEYAPSDGTATFTASYLHAGQYKLGLVKVQNPWFADSGPTIWIGGTDFESARVITAGVGETVTGLDFELPSPPTPAPTPTPTPTPKPSPGRVVIPPPRNLAVTLRPGGTVKVTWQQPVLPRGIPAVNYRVRISNAKRNSFYAWRSTPSRGAVFRGLAAHKQYVVQVVAVTSTRHSAAATVLVSTTK